MTEHIREFICEPRLIKSGATGILGFITAEHVRGALQWVVLMGTAFLIVTQITTWVVRHFICRPRDGKGPCSACNFFGRWQCPGPRKTTETERIENKYE